MDPIVKAANDFGEPDAGNPPVRFDEGRGSSFIHGMRILRHKRGNPDTSYADSYCCSNSPLLLYIDVGIGFQWNHGRDSIYANSDNVTNQSNQLALEGRG